MNIDEDISVVTSDWSSSGRYSFARGKTLGIIIVKSTNDCGSLPSLTTRRFLSAISLSIGKSLAGECL